MMSDFYKAERTHNVTLHGSKNGAVHAGAITVVASTGVPISGRFAFCKTIGSADLVGTKREVTCKRCLKLTEKDA